MGVIVKVAGGVAALAAALASELTADIVFDAPVTAIEQSSGGVAAHSPRAVVDARAIVVALSPGLVDRIAFAPPLPRGRILLQRAWHDRPSTKTLVVYDRCWWLDRGLAGTAVGDRPAAPLVLDGSAPGHPDGVLAAFSSCRDTEVTPAAIVADLVHYFGDAAATPREVVSHDWSAEHWTGGCGSAPPPGLLSRFGPTLRAPVGHVFWAGTETAMLCTYNMEGAITAGHRAADEVAMALGHTSKATTTDPISDRMFT